MDLGAPSPLAGGAAADADERPRRRPERDLVLGIGKAADGLGGGVRTRGRSTGDVPTEGMLVRLPALPSLRRGGR